MEPWTGSSAGRDAIARLEQPAIVTVDARGEDMPFDTGSIDIVYARQTLHHADDLSQMMAESARVLRPGGVLFTCRDHVVDDDAQLAVFLAGHPVHRLAGGEHAYRLDEYLGAIRAAGLRVKKVLGPWDSIINAFPHVRSEEERQRVFRKKYVKRWGTAGRVHRSHPRRDSVGPASDRPPPRPRSGLHVHGRQGPLAAAMFGPAFVPPGAAPIDRIATFAA